MVRGLGIGSIPGVNRSSTEPCIPAPQDHAGLAPPMSRNRRIIAPAKRCWISLQISRLPVLGRIRWRTLKGEPEPPVTPRSASGQNVNKRLKFDSDQ